MLSHMGVFMVIDAIVPSILWQTHQSPSIHVWVLLHKLKTSNVS